MESMKEEIVRRYRERYHARIQEALFALYEESGAKKEAYKALGMGGEWFVDRKRRKSAFKLDALCALLEYKGKDPGAWLYNVMRPEGAPEIDDTLQEDSEDDELSKINFEHLDPQLKDVMDAVYEKTGFKP